MADRTNARDCPCIDSSRILSSKSNCIREEDGSPGVWIPFSSSNGGLEEEEKNDNTQIMGSCYPVSFGSNECAAHDKLADPRCKQEEEEAGLAPAPVPGYCQERWCYVDPTACKLSSEYFFHSKYLEDDLYYSYSACNSTADHWLEFDSTQKTDGIDLKVAIPGSYFPFHYKMSSTTPGEIAAFRGDEYYNDTIPWQGFFMNYFNDVVELSNIGQVSYTFSSRGSDVKEPSSSWTATVHDVQAGISCLGVSNFWITAERLKLSGFTTSIAIDKLYLWIQSPHAAAAAESEATTLGENVYKTLAPFTPSLWFLTLGLLVFVAILSVIFASQHGELGAYWERMRSPRWKKSSYLGRARMFVKMSLESFLLNTTYAVTQSAGINTNNSLAQKLTNVGFGFFILILVTAYTANLAAFLTVSLAENLGYIKGIEDAVARGRPICAYAALKEDLTRDWPNGNFVFVDQAADQLKAYDAGTCVGLIYTHPRFMLDFVTPEFCKRELVMTGPPVLEIPMGFPVCAEYAAGISHWMHKAQKRGIFVTSYFESGVPEEGCSFDIVEEAENNRDMGRLTINDFALPLLAFAVCIGLAVLSHIYHLPRFYRMRGLITGRSTRNMTTSSTTVTTEGKDHQHHWQDRMEQKQQHLDESMKELKQMMMVLSATQTSSSSTASNPVMDVPPATASSGSATISNRRTSAVTDNINTSSTQAGNAATFSGKHGVDVVPHEKQIQRNQQQQQQQQRMSLPVQPKKHIQRNQQQQRMSLPLHPKKAATESNHPRRHTSEWRTAVDPNSGDTYYYHPTTRQSRWQFEPLNMEAHI